MTREEYLNQAKEELYTAIQAIEDGDLPFARSSSTRAAGLITNAWQADRPKINPEVVQLTKGIQVGREIRPMMAKIGTGRSLMTNLLSPSDD